MTDFIGPVWGRASPGTPNWETGRISRQDNRLHRLITPFPVVVALEFPCEPPDGGGRDRAIGQSERAQMGPAACQRGILGNALRGQHLERLRRDL